MSVALRYMSRGVEKDYRRPPVPLDGARKGEVLRFEVRLVSKKLKDLLTTLDLSTPLTLKCLFSAAVARAILQHYWAGMVEGLYALNFEASGCDELEKRIREKFPRKRATTVLALVGFIVTCQQFGPSGARLLMRLSDSQFYRLKGEAKKLGRDAKGWRFVTLGKIREQLDAFAPFNQGDLKKRMPD